MLVAAIKKLRESNKKIVKFKENNILINKIRVLTGKINENKQNEH